MPTNDFMKNFGVSKRSEIRTLFDKRMPGETQGEEGAVADEELCPGGAQKFAVCFKLSQRLDG